MNGATIAMLAMISVALVMVHPTKALSCGDLGVMLLPCVGYLRGGGLPTTECCNGVLRVQDATQNQDDRRIACSCAQSAAGQFGVSQDAALSLPEKCGISSTFPVDPNVDCNTIP